MIPAPMLRRSRRPVRRVAVIGAGMGGLAAAIDLAAAGLDVTLLEQWGAPGGKMREVMVDGRPIDSGPTVFTMRWVFDGLFQDAGERLEDHLPLQPAAVLARHAWAATPDALFDLYADVARSAEAVGDLAGAAEAERFRAFCDRARQIYRTLEGPFIRSQRPNPIGLVRRAGPGGLGDLWRIKPFATLWQGLGSYFHDPRLRQLFGRYATYTGSSPFQAPATMMLIAHVEQAGVWYVEGGMHRTARELAALAERKGATIRYDSPVAEIRSGASGVTGVRLASGEVLEVEAVVANADVAALAAGRFGRPAARAVSNAEGARSLSAITWSLVAEAQGTPLLRHTVFFGRDYAAEFDDVFRHKRVPGEPTAYICAQDRGDSPPRDAGPERLLCLINAPAIGDRDSFDEGEIERCRTRTFDLLSRCGLSLRVSSDAHSVATTPATFDGLFPGRGGALYGRASHGWKASFERPGARTRMPGLYLAGGSVHPGAGVPMAAMSGRLAAQCLLRDCASTSRSRPVATRGGTSTP